MLVRWYLNPLSIRRGFRDVRRIASGGGPRSVRLDGIGDPRGVIIPRVPIRLEVIARDGSIARLEPEVPIGLLAGYTYRVGSWLDLPIIGSLDPARLKTEVRIPGR